MFRRSLEFAKAALRSSNQFLPPLFRRKQRSGFVSQRTSVRPRIVATPLRCTTLLSNMALLSVLAFFLRTTCEEQGALPVTRVLIGWCNTQLSSGRRMRFSLLCCLPCRGSLGPSISIVSRARLNLFKAEKAFPADTVSRTGRSSEPVLPPYPHVTGIVSRWRATNITISNVDSVSYAK